ncbi:MAG: sulfide/dihydroorotate dehydrogenase-like FAD/NAD-binding protein, partial [Candidatus Omnitrophica bacterium]|nr:sulfide/dihydroorotate dehydrogenase-like FAD/NAD-binding protein [Candidatus Omnitrophota bacterium]
PLVAQKARPGQFVVLIIDEFGERIPLTLADWDKKNGTITLIFQKIGFTTKKLASLNKGESVSHILGPLGQHTQIGKLGEIYCVAGGVGIAELFPIAKGFKQAGNRIIGIIGARSQGLLILEKELKGLCDELFVITDDGSSGNKGLVTDVLKGLLSVIEKSTHTKYPALVYAVGPVRMMRAVAELTRGYQINTVVSLNPIMVDATGMCGSCRCTVAGKTVFGCVDGPDFDGHSVDFGELEQRLKFFEVQERRMR